MHPPKDKLERYCDKVLEGLQLTEVERHLAECEFCREYCQQYRHLADEIAKSDDAKIDFYGQKITAGIIAQLENGKIIPLFIISAPGISIPRQMAADGPPEEKDFMHSLITLGSEDPEIILRVMHDPKTNSDFLHLIGENAEQTANVLVQIPEIGREFLTDINGRATIDTPLTDIDKLKWQIKLPSAVFELEKIEYDAEKVESSSRTVLTSDRDDKIEIVFERKMSGAQINIRVLEIEGRAAEGTIRAVVAQKDAFDSRLLKPNQAAVFDIADSGESIKIRLFV